MVAGLKICVSSKSWRSFWRVLKFENHSPKWSGITLPALRFCKLKSSRPYVSLSFLLNCELFERKKWAWNLINCQYFLLCVASNEGVSIIKILHKLGYLINNYVFLNVNDLFPVSLYCIWHIIPDPVMTAMSYSFMLWPLFEFWLYQVLSEKSTEELLCQQTWGAYKRYCNQFLQRILLQASYVLLK